jgi:hypothetical protein
MALVMAAAQRRETVAAVVRMPEPAERRRGLALPKALRCGPAIRGRPTFATDDPGQARSWAPDRLGDL